MPRPWSKAPPIASRHVSRSIQPALDSAIYADQWGDATCRLIRFAPASLHQSRADACPRLPVLPAPARDAAWTAPAEPATLANPVPPRGRMAPVKSCHVSSPDALVVHGCVHQISGARITVPGARIHQKMLFWIDLICFSRRVHFSRPFRAQPTLTHKNERP